MVAAVNVVVGRLYG